jgi:hypothetical protein
MKTLEQIKLDAIKGYCKAQLEDIEAIKMAEGYSEDIMTKFITTAREYELRTILTFIENGGEQNDKGY